MKIFLVGMPGSGKSTLGRTVAKRLNHDFFDLDTLIVEQEGMSIPDIFARHGEAYFREAERTALVRTGFRQGAVVATGGGTPCFFDNMDWMKSRGVVVWLDIAPAIIASRLTGSLKASQQRPLFAGKSKEEITETLNSMHQQRQPFYQLAQIRVGEKEARPGLVLQKLKDLAG